MAPSGASLKLLLLFGWVSSASSFVEIPVQPLATHRPSPVVMSFAYTVSDPALMWTTDDWVIDVAGKLYHLAASSVVD